MANDLHQVMRDTELGLETSFGAELCRVANTVEAEDEEVFVTLPNSEAPAKRVPVAEWRLQVAEGGTARYPQRGDVGLAIYTDTGEIWLIY